MGWTGRATAPRVTETVEATSGKKIRLPTWYSQEGDRLFKTGAYFSLPDVSKLVECSTYHRSLEFGRSCTSSHGSSPACSAGDRTATHKAIFVSSDSITRKRAMMGPRLMKSLLQYRPRFHQRVCVSLHGQQLSLQARKCSDAKRDALPDQRLMATLPQGIMIVFSRAAT